jgi:hypothetical protein
MAFGCCRAARSVRIRLPVEFPDNLRRSWMNNTASNVPLAIESTARRSVESFPVNSHLLRLV